MRQSLITAYKPLIRNAAEEIIKRERADIMRQAEKDFKSRNVMAFNEWVEDFYSKHNEFIERKMKPVLMSFAQAVNVDAAEEIETSTEFTERHSAFVDAYLASYTKKHIARSKSKVEEMAKETEPIIALEQKFDQWEESRIDSIANEESVQAGNAFTKMTWMIGGITKLRWQANSGACEFCQSMDGKVVGIDQSFAIKGESISSATGENPPMQVLGTTGHPPLHSGCMCTISPSF